MYKLFHDIPLTDHYKIEQVQFNEDKFNAIQLFLYTAFEILELEI